VRERTGGRVKEIGREGEGREREKEWVGFREWGEQQNYIR
jgi:hypothetical protein